MTSCLVITLTKIPLNVRNQPFLQSYSKYTGISLSGMYFLQFLHAGPFKAAYMYMYTVWVNPKEHMKFTLIRFWLCPMQSKFLQWYEFRHVYLGWTMQYMYYPPCSSLLFGNRNYKSNCFVGIVESASLRNSFPSVDIFLYFGVSLIYTFFSINSWNS